MQINSFLFNLSNQCGIIGISVFIDPSPHKGREPGVAKCVSPALLLGYLYSILRPRTIWLATCKIHMRDKNQISRYPWADSSKSSTICTIGPIKCVFTLCSHVLRFSKIQSPCLTLGLMSSELLWERLSCCRLPEACASAKSHINIQCKTLQIHRCLQVGFPCSRAFNGRKYFLSIRWEFIVRSPQTATPCSVPVKRLSWLCVSLFPWSRC